MPRWLQFGIFLSITLAIYSGVHLYIYSRIATMLALPPGRALWALRIVFVFLALSFIVSRLLLEWSLSPLVRAFYWMAALWMGFLLYLLLSCLAAHLLSGLFHLTGLWDVLAQGNSLRLGRLLCLLVFAASSATSVAAYFEAIRPPKIAELEIPVKGGSLELDGFTIVQISDIHLGVIVDGHRLERIVAEVNRLQPDLAVITGDIMDENADRLLALDDPLKQLKSRYGVFAVTGNHDYYAGAENVVRHAEEIGVRFLQNEKITLPNGLILCGLNDPTAARYGHAKVPLEQVLGAEADTTPVVLLYHQPILFEKAAALGVDLMLSGHTHHGQVWPASYVSRLFYPYQYGHYVMGASHLYVSAGAGTWGPPMRLDSPPEITRIRLRTKKM